MTVAAVPPGWLIETNNGTITVNYGTVRINAATVSNNHARGTVMLNSGASAVVTSNYGMIVNNYSPAVVTANYARGEITWNYGTVTNNNLYATVGTNRTNGTVTTNAGIVSVNYGTVTTNNGTVSMNYGTVTTNNLTVRYPVNTDSSGRTDLVDSPNATAQAALATTYWSKTTAALKSLAAGTIGYALATFIDGVTSIGKWLGLGYGKTADAATLAEVNATTAGATYNNVTDSLEAQLDSRAAAIAGAPTSTITYSVSTSSTGLAPRVDVTLYQNRAIPSTTITAATSQTGKDHQLIVFDKRTPTTVAWSLDNTHFTINGTSVTFADGDTNTKTAGDWWYQIVNTTDDLVICEGSLHIEAGPETVSP